LKIGVCRDAINFQKMRGFAMHNDFTMFKRSVPSGKRVVYYYAYDENGNRKGPWTTKCQNLTQARNFIHKLIKNGVLIPDRKKAITFGEFASGFWETDSEYVRYQRSRKEVADNYIFSSKKLMENQILPFFGNTVLDKITDKDVDKWLLGFKDRGIKDEKTDKIIGYANSYANGALCTINIMLGEAVRQGLIKTNPCDFVKRLRDIKKKIEILTIEEVRRLFPKDYESVWGKKIIAYAANLMASITGMRIGEVLGLRGEYIFESYILVCGQYGEWGYQDKTKTKENRSIPVMPEMMALLQMLMKDNGKGFVFSLNGGATPVSRNYVATEFGRALNKIGISNDEIRKRGLSLHGWRHFLNTELQRQGLTIQQVQGVTGHKSKRMTDWYSHLDARNITDVTKAQAAILGEEQKRNVQEDRNEAVPVLALVKSSDKEMIEQKLA